MCQCTPSSACGGCYDYAKYMPHLLQKDNSTVVVNDESQSTSNTVGEDTQPGWVQTPVASTVPNCPAGNVDCGYCKCTPAGTCAACFQFGTQVLQPALSPLAPHLLEENATAVEVKNQQPGFVA